MGRPATCDCGECKKCKHRAYMRAWQAAHPGYAARVMRLRKAADPEAVRAKQRADYLRNRESRIERIRLQQTVVHPDRHYARMKIRACVKKGWIVKPGICEKCAKECKPHAHHRNYALPHVVDWLCLACHGLEHRTF